MRTVHGSQRGSLGALARRRGGGRRSCMVEATATTPSSRLAAQMATVKEMRTSMDNDPQLSVFMDGLRGKGQDVSDFAASGVTMRVVEVDSVAGSEDSLPLEYEPESIARFWGKRPAAVVQRCFQLLGIAGKFLGNLAFDAWRSKLAETEVARACELRDIVTSLGPAYIKLGQALSIRPDLLSPAAMRELQKLCDKVPSFPNEVAFALIEKELGAPWTTFYSELGPDPIAAASLGQVYKGKLLGTGEIVAVKVQRPYVLETVTVDLYIIRRIGIFLRRFELPTDVVGLLDEWASRFFEELDYVREGQNATRFAAMMAADLPQVVVPKTFSDFTTRRVLTATWLEGEKLSQSTESDVGTLVQVGVVCYLKQLLDTGFFHADPHPGNLIRTPDGRLAILDFGLMTQIDDNVKYGMIEAISHLIHRDYEAIVVDFVTLDFIPPDVDLKPLLPVLARVFDSALEGGGAKNFNFQALAGDLAQITFDYPFRIPPYFALIIRAIGVLEGIALVGNPDFALVDEAYPFIAKKLLTDPSPRLRAALTYMVYGKKRVLDAERLIDLLSSYETFVVASRSARGTPHHPAAIGAAAVALSPPALPAASSTTALVPQPQGVAPAAPQPLPQPLPPPPRAAAEQPAATREALAFLFSPQGLFFRDFVLDEIVAGIDAGARVAAADAVSRAGLSRLRLPVFLPFAAARSLPLAPDVTPEDRAVVANCVKLLSFLSGTTADGGGGGGRGFSQALLDEIVPLLPSVAREVAPQVAQRLASRLAARTIRELFLPAYGAGVVAR